MTAEPNVSDEIRRAIGHETEPVVVEIDKTLITRFADAVGDTNPLWTDGEAARRGRYGGVVAPSSLLCSGMMQGNRALAAVEHLLPKRGLDGGGEWEFFAPIRVGDKITITNKLAEIAERPGRLGTMMIVTSEITWRNQRQELVAKARSTQIRY